MAGHTGSREQCDPAGVELDGHKHARVPDAGSAGNVPHHGPFLEGVGCAGFFGECGQIFIGDGKIKGKIQKMQYFMQIECRGHAIAVHRLLPTASKPNASGGIHDWRKRGGPIVFGSGRMGGYRCASATPER